MREKKKAIMKSYQQSYYEKNYYENRGTAILMGVGKRGDLLVEITLHKSKTKITAFLKKYASNRLENKLYDDFAAKKIERIAVEVQELLTERQRRFYAKPVLSFVYRADDKKIPLGSKVAAILWKLNNNGDPHVIINHDDRGIESPYHAYVKRLPQNEVTAVLRDYIIKKETVENIKFEVIYVPENSIYRPYLLAPIWTPDLWALVEQEFSI